MTSGPKHGQQPPHTCKAARQKAKAADLHSMGRSSPTASPGRWCSTRSQRRPRDCGNNWHPIRRSGTVRRCTRAHGGSGSPSVGKCTPSGSGSGSHDSRHRWPFPCARCSLQRGARQRLRKTCQAEREGRVRERGREGGRGGGASIEAASAGLFYHLRQRRG